MSLDPIDQALSSYCAQLANIAADRIELEREKNSNEFTQKCKSLFERCEKVYEGLERIASKQVPQKNSTRYIAVVEKYDEQIKNINSLRKEHLFSGVISVVPPNKEDEKELPQKQVLAAMVKIAKCVGRGDVEGFQAEMIELRKQYPVLGKQIDQETGELIKKWIECGKKEDSQENRKTEFGLQDAIFKITGRIADRIRKSGF